MTEKLSLSVLLSKVAKKKKKKVIRETVKIVEVAGFRGESE